MHAFIQLLYLQSRCIAIQNHPSYEQLPKLSARPSAVYSLLSNEITLVWIKALPNFAYAE